jgi:hypothetical protein
MVTKTLFLLLLLSSTAAAQSNISITFTPTFERYEFEPVLVIAVTNNGNTTLTNMTVSIETSGLDRTKVTFINSNDFLVKQLDAGITQTFTFQFKYPDTRDDITVFTRLKSDQENVSIRFTIPAIITANISRYSMFPRGAVYFLMGLIALAAVYYFRKKSKGYSEKSLRGHDLE